MERWDEDIVVCGGCHGDLRRSDREDWRAGEWRDLAEVVTESLVYATETDRNGMMGSLRSGLASETMVVSFLVVRGCGFD